VISIKKQQQKILLADTTCQQAEQKSANNRICKLTHYHSQFHRQNLIKYINLQFLKHYVPEPLQM